jgi:protein tyrosine phosphatase
MTAILSSIPSISTSLCQQVASSFFNDFKISSRTLKVAAVAALAFAALGQLIYFSWRYMRISSHQKELYPPTSKSAFQRILKKIKKINPFKAKVPPLPSMNYKAVFSELATQTGDIQYLPRHVASCRFIDIACPKATAVKVISDEIYLHANYVTLEGHKFIATQYPLPLQFPMFWEMCQQACLIVDLTNSDDVSKRGLIAYYPEYKISKQCGNLELTCHSKKEIEDLPDAHLYTYHVKENGEGKSQAEQIEFTIPRLHYQGWNDTQGISEEALRQIIDIIKFYQQKDPSRPVLVHCSAGVGRTGTLIVACALNSLIDQKKINSSNLEGHIRRLILEGRPQRNHFFVQTQKQLETLWKWGWQALHRA